MLFRSDAPSGTAIALRNAIQQASGSEISAALGIASFREGEVIGRHQLQLDSADDAITIEHNSKSRRGFAEGAVLAAEWLAGRKGFFDFREIWREI